MEEDEFATLILKIELIALRLQSSSEFLGYLGPNPDNVSSSFKGPCLWSVYC